MKKLLKYGLIGAGLGLGISLLLTLFLSRGIFPAKILVNTYLIISFPVSYLLKLILNTNSWAIMFYTISSLLNGFIIGAIIGLITKRFRS